MEIITDSTDSFIHREVSSIHREFSFLFIIQRLFPSRTFFHTQPSSMTNTRQWQWFIPTGLSCLNYGIWWNHSCTRRSVHSLSTSRFDPAMTSSSSCCVRAGQFISYQTSRFEPAMTSYSLFFGLVHAHPFFWILGTHVIPQNLNRPWHLLLHFVHAPVNSSPLIYSLCTRQDSQNTRYFDLLNHFCTRRIWFFEFHSSRYHDWIHAPRVGKDTCPPSRNSQTPIYIYMWHHIYTLGVYPRLQFIYILGIFAVPPWLLFICTLGVYPRLQFIYIWNFRRTTMVTIHIYTLFFLFRSLLSTKIRP